MRITTKAAGILVATTALLGLGAGAAFADTPAQATTPNQVSLVNQSGGNLVITHYTDATFFAKAPKVGTVIKTGASLPIDLNYNPNNEVSAQFDLEAYSASGADLGDIVVQATGGRNTSTYVELNDTTLAPTANGGTVTIAPTPTTQTLNVTVYNKSNELFEVAGYQQTAGNQLQMFALDDPVGTIIPAHGSETFPVSFSSAVQTQGNFTVNELNGNGGVFGSLTVNVFSNPFNQPASLSTQIPTDSTDTHNTAKGASVVIADYPTAQHH